MGKNNNRKLIDIKNRFNGIYMSGMEMERCHGIVRDIQN